MGAARAATCVRKEIRSSRDEMINIWRGLSKRGVGWRPAWQSYWSRRDFIPLWFTLLIVLSSIWLRLCPSLTSFLTLPHQTLPSGTKKSLFIYWLHPTQEPLSPWKKGYPRKILSRNSIATVSAGGRRAPKGKVLDLEKTKSSDFEVSSFQCHYEDKSQQRSIIPERKENDHMVMSKK